MDFPPFEQLLYYERVHGARLNISLSNIREFRLDGFGRSLPKDLDLNWTFRNGTPELRRLIARRHRTSPNRVLVTTGATEGNFLVNASLVHPRDQVLVDIPIYSPLRDVPRGVGAKVVEIPRECKDGWRLDLDRWRNLAGRRACLLVFANLNNPTSTALSRSDLRALADIAEECDGHVLVDETFRELAFENRPPSAAEFGPRMIALSTVTKVCGLGTLRVGWIVGAPDLLERFAGFKDYTPRGGSIVSPPIAPSAPGRWATAWRGSGWPDPPGAAGPGAVPVATVPEAPAGSAPTTRPTTTATIASRAIAPRAFVGHSPPEGQRLTR